MGACVERERKLMGMKEIERKKKLGRYRQKIAEIGTIGETNVEVEDVVTEVYERTKVVKVDSYENP